MYGRARCRECGKTIEAEVEKDIRCPRCGRIFQIPNRPQYIIGAVGPYRSIPAITSTGPNRSPLVSSFGRHIKSTYPRENDEWQARIQPLLRKRGNGAAKQVINLFPEQTEPYVEEENGVLTIIIEFPQHNLEQIQWRVEGDLLTVESAIFVCPYRQGVRLPDWAREPTEVKLRNGLFTMKFEK